MLPDKALEFLQFAASRLVGGRTKDAQRKSIEFDFLTGEWATRREMLDYLLHDYVKLNKEIKTHTDHYMFRAPGTPWTDDDEKERFVNYERITRLRMCIESFYLLADVMMDDIAASVQYFLYDARESAWNHRILTERVTAASKPTAKPQHRIMLPPGFLEAAKGVEEIIQFRNKAIQHRRNRRTATALAFGKNSGEFRGQISRTAVPFPATPGETINQESGDLTDLLRGIDEYIVLLCAFFAINLEKSIFRDVMAVEAV